MRDNLKGAAIIAVVVVIGFLLFGRGSSKTPGAQAAAARAFGSDIQAERYSAACALLTPDSRAALDAAGGCATSIASRVDARLAAALANEDYECIYDIHNGPVAQLHGIGVRGRNGCQAFPVFLTLNRVGGRWLVAL